jgi:DNA-binding MarR family transcriptional regulator
LADRKTRRTGDEPRSLLENRALIAARALVDRMRSLYRELEQLTGAPITLHRAMVCISDAPGLTASQLAQQLGMKRPAVSQLLNNLEARGWIERRRGEGDHRLILIQCTAAGRRLLQATSGRAVFTLQRAVCRLPDDQLARLASGVEMLLQQLPLSAESPATIRKRRARRLP